MAEEKQENQTIETLTKEYEKKIADREKEFILEKEAMKKDFENEKKQLQDTHNKEVAEIIRGRKSIEEVQKEDEENDKSYFDKQVEETKKKLGITKGEK